jgi:putative endonuclease
MAGGWVYIMTNRLNGTLYVGTTTDLARRVWEHREGVADGFTKRYGLSAWFMPNDTITSSPRSSAR